MAVPAAPRNRQVQEQSRVPPNSSSKKAGSTVTKAPASLSKDLSRDVPQEKVTRRSSKPLINWFQRKLTPTVKHKPTDEPIPQPSGPSEHLKHVRTVATLPSRSTNAPPPLSLNSGRASSRLDASTKRKTISLNGDDAFSDYPNRDDLSTDSSWVARVSAWSPSSALEADEDASLRPLPPSLPPSPSPSRSSSSFISDSHTFTSMAASTKPTTLLSVDLGGGMAHIAQAPLTPTSQFHRVHGRSSSTTATNNFLGANGSLTFSSFPQAPSRPTSITLSAAPNTGSSHLAVQAPLHTAHHPRNNPRPSSPPLDNASVLTLASSAFGIPGHRGGHLPDSSSVAPSALGGDSVSHFDGGSLRYGDGESTARFLLGDEDRIDEGGFDASVRALRAQSSRRNSWESEASRWSAGLRDGSGQSLMRQRSGRTTFSMATGAFSKGPDDGADEDMLADTEGETEIAGDGTDDGHTSSQVIICEPDTTPVDNFCLQTSSDLSTKQSPPGPQKIETSSAIMNSLEACQKR